MGIYQLFSYIEFDYPKKSNGAKKFPDFEIKKIQR